MISGRLLHPGHAVAPVLRLDEPVSFWGGVDPVTGIIIDRAHPQAGTSMAGAIVAMPGSRGSSGTPGVLGEALRRGTGPAALIVAKGDANLVAGALVAAALYDVACPVVLVDEADLDRFRTGDRATVDGPTISVTA
ncbi:MAG: DUF126 domain-containing protein [Actinomycetota bacterium]